MKLGAVYFSGGNVVATLVDAALAAVQDAGVETYAYSIAGSSIVEGRFVDTALLSALESCDAVIFASPTYMGGVAAQFKAFMDATSELWCEQRWAGKIAAGITCGGALNGDQSSTLQNLVTFASQHGMIWVGLDAAQGYTDHGVNRLGCQLGVVAQTTTDVVETADLATAAFLG